MVGGWPSDTRRDARYPPLRKEGDAYMTIDFTIAAFLLAVFSFGVAVGKLVEKIERSIRKCDDEKHSSERKNDRRQ